MKNWIYPPPHGGVVGHAHKLIVGPLRGTGTERLVIAQSGREHPYEGVDTKRATFWLRVMQAMGVETLIGSNAAGVITPTTLKVPALMLVQSDLDLGADSPLVGRNDPLFGLRFPHMGDHYPRATRDLIAKVAAREGIDLSQGTYVRTKGPNYESQEMVYLFRSILRGMWTEAQQQPGEDEFKFDPATGDPVGTFGMSTTYESAVAQHAAVDEEDVPAKHPAFRKGRAWISTATNNACGIGEKGKGVFPSHKEVGENARIVQNRFGRLVRESILELRKAA